MSDNPNPGGSGKPDPLAPVMEVLQTVMAKLNVLTDELGAIKRTQQKQGGRLDNVEAEQTLTSAEVERLEEESQRASSLLLGGNSPPHRRGSITHIVFNETLCD